MIKKRKTMIKKLSDKKLLKETRIVNSLAGEKAGQVKETGIATK